MFAIGVMWLTLMTFQMEFSDFVFLRNSWHNCSVLKMFIDAFATNRSWTMSNNEICFFLQTTCFSSNILIFAWLGKLKNSSVFVWWTNSEKRKILTFSTGTHPIDFYYLGIKCIISISSCCVFWKLHFSFVCSQYVSSNLFVFCTKFYLYFFL